MELKEALKKLRSESKGRKFKQSVDLIINLRGVDVKKENISVVINIPHKIKEKKVCGFLTKKSSLVNTVTEAEFAKYKEKKALKNLVKSFDFFVAIAPLMPKVATNFGMVLGPVGKMPSPQLGILTTESDEAIKEVLEKISKAVKIRAKEPSIKLVIGKEDMKDEEIVSNINAVYKAIVNVLPTKKENIRNVMLKFTMGKPLKVEVK
jgi:large subunit ribosomal protein L1